jgi:hypothetical protein
MNGDSFIRVSYAILKSEFAAKPLRMFYIETPVAGPAASYDVFVVCPIYGLTCTILSSSDITDFEASFKAAATVVANADEAAALAQLPLLTNPILPNSKTGRSYGYISTSAVTTKQLRSTVYTAPGTNAQRSIVSTSAADAAAGTGARTVKITYMAADGSGPFTETVTLNGVTPVNTVATNIAFIERIDVLTVGSGGSNAGTISLMTLVAGGGTAIWTIPAGDNQTNGAHHYVPLGVTAYILAMEGAASVVAGVLTVNTLNPVNAVVAQVQPDLSIRHGLIHMQRPFPVPVPVVGPALVFLNTKPDAATASVTFGGFSWMHQ